MRYCPTCASAYPDKSSGTCPKDGSVLISEAEHRAQRADPMIGTTITGRYHIRGKIGTGGMGTVYEAMQHGLGRHVALKVLKKELVHDRETVGRFHREAKAMSLLLHPNTVRVFDFGEDPTEGHLFLAMERLEGELLTARIETAGELLDIDVAIEFARQLLSSLAEAHGKGLIHRDLKPDNIYLARVEGHPRPIIKVLDFGIAKVFRDDGAIDQLETQAGTVFGTPRYMSPEQAQGKPLDPRSDLYAVAVLVYQMIVGHCPFIDDDAVVVMAKHIRDRPTPLRAAAPERPIPPSLERVVMKGLEKSPDDRYRNAEEFEKALVACLPDVAAERAKMLEGRRSQPLGERLRDVPRVPAMVAAAVVLLALVGAGIVLGTGGGSADSPRPGITVRALPSTAVTAPPPGPAVPAPPATRSVRVASEPPGAEIWSGDRLLGTAPYALDVALTGPTPPLELRLPDHETASLDLATVGESATVTMVPERPRRGASSGASARRGSSGGSEGASEPTSPPDPPDPPPSGSSSSGGTTVSAGGYERFD